MANRCTLASRFGGVWSCLALLMAAVAAAPATPPPGEAVPTEEGFQPQLVTAQTRADVKKLGELQKPGKVVFEDGFESEGSLKKYFEIRGLKEGRAKLVTDAGVAHSGKGAIQFTAPAKDGRESGAGASAWLGAEGYDRLYFRRYIKFAADYDQGNLNHTGGGLAAVAGADRWRAMGSAGIRPKGDDHFNSAFEPGRGWGKYAAPGYMFLYTYWMDMKRDPDGNYWGTMLGPKEDERIVPERGRWYCLEHMIRANDVGKANGELAAWIDGKLYIHCTGLRWRTSDAVKLKRFDIGIYIHQAKKDNTAWYDDVVVSTGYVGPVDAKEAKPKSSPDRKADVDR